MDERLPEDFDVIIVGTGLKESILSGAFSRIGKRVLHIDYYEYYGDNWASFTLKAFEDFLKISSNPSANITEGGDTDIASLCSADEEFFKLQNPRQTVFGFVDVASGAAPAAEGTAAPETSTAEVPEVEAATAADKTTAPSGQEFDTPATADDGEAAAAAATSEDRAEAVTSPAVVGESQQQQQSSESETNASESDGNSWLYEKSRQFNIDITPKLLFARGPLVDLLIKSNVSRYLEFKMVDRIIAARRLDHKLMVVPCSRADVFNSSIPPMGKRKLMKLLVLAASYEEHADKYEAFRDKPYREFLRSQGLDEMLQDVIVYSIGMVTDETNTLEGLESTQKFLRSLGRFGNGAFLWPSYGVGDIPQAFSRLSGIFGGTFCLRRTAQCLVVNKETGKATSIVDNTGQKIKAEHVILNERIVPLPDAEASQPASRCVRAVYIINKSIYEDAAEHISLGMLHATETEPSVRTIEVGPSGGVCPKDCFILHALVDVQRDYSNCDDIKKVFERVEQTLFSKVGPNEENSSKPSVVWSAYFQVSSKYPGNAALPSNVHSVSGPNSRLDFSEAVSEARNLFSKVCPTEEFLPRAPDPEEIDFNYTDEGYTTEASGSSQSVSTTTNEATATADAIVEQTQTSQSISQNHSVELNQQNNNTSEYVETNTAAAET